ncbi:MAG: hypothetical protein AAGD86_04605 [Pseudomonadota bacterium]
MVFVSRARIDSARVLGKVLLFVTGAGKRGADEARQDYLSKNFTNGFPKHGDSVPDFA